ncbi:Arc family DNA-binding protein [Acinetobacter bereziniae]|uniref:Arc family DNA-binding protein n=1 Tax=Acinetobacter bereziniae TaxID=106648 RepID=UPI0021E3CB97|nr:Arc family DNA-binding protein [Acinetobacter bereziniae]MCV2445533.1 Arc family DNA-binding protein [Acinetobacter bereziniae]
MADDVQFNLRIPAILKDKVKEAAKESGRSINAEAQYRLEQSFEPLNQDPLNFVNDPLVKIHFVGVELIRYEAKMQALRFAIRSISDSDEILKNKLSYLLDYTQYEKESLISDLFKEINENGLSLNLIPDENIKNKIEYALAEFSKEIASSTPEELKNKYPNWE